MSNVVVLAALHSTMDWAGRLLGVEEEVGAPFSIDARRAHSDPLSEPEVGQTSQLLHVPPPYSALAVNPNPPGSPALTTLHIERPPNSNIRSRLQGLILRPADSHWVRRVHSADSKVLRIDSRGSFRHN